MITFETGKLLSTWWIVFKRNSSTCDCQSFSGRPGERASRPGRTSRENRSVWSLRLLFRILYFIALKPYTIRLLALTLGSVANTSPDNHLTHILAKTAVGYQDLLPPRIVTFLIRTAAISSQLKGFQKPAFEALAGDSLTPLGPVTSTTGKQLYVMTVSKREARHDTP